MTTYAKDTPRGQHARKASESSRVYVLNAILRHNGWDAPEDVPAPKLHALADDMAEGDRLYKIMISPNRTNDYTIDQYVGLCANVRKQYEAVESKWVCSN